MKTLRKLRPGQRVAVLSPSFAAPGMFPEVFELGLQRLRDVFGLVPVEFPTTRKLGATKEERMRDLIAAFEDPDIKAVFASIGGDDQVTYIKRLPDAPFAENPKPFFGYSDNTHFMNFLWQNGIPSFYGGSVMTQCAMQGHMDDYTVASMRKALFETGETEIVPSKTFNEIGLGWRDPANLSKERVQEKNDGWYWDRAADASGLTWGGCLESIDELLRHDIPLPSLEEFERAVLVTETCEEISPAAYVARVYRALGERGILGRVRAVLVGRPKAWEFDKPQEKDVREQYRRDQRETILRVVRAYNPHIPVVQNLDFGHTDPQIALPYGMPVRLEGASQKIFVTY